MNRSLDNNSNWQELEQFFNQLPLVTRLGIKVSFAKPAQPRCEINDVQLYHLGGIGQDYINGVVISGIVDLALGLTALAESNMGEFATTNLSINLAKPVSNGRFYVISESKQKIGRKIFSEAIVYDKDDNPCVYATGIIRIGITKDK